MALIIARDIQGRDKKLTDYHNIMSAISEQNDGNSPRVTISITYSKLIPVMS